MKIVGINYKVCVKDIMKIIEREYEPCQIELFDILISLKGVSHILYDSHAGNVVYFTIDSEYDTYKTKKRIKQIIKSFENFNYKSWGNKGWR